MVTCKLVGGLGNQAFQIAATIGLAVKHGVNYKIPEHSVNTTIWQTYFHHLPKLLPTDKITSFYKEPSHAYNEIPYTYGMCLDGYFQSEKYFNNCRSTIVDLFTNGYPSNRIHKTVGIHVRRGDYLIFPTKHPVVTMQYLSNAVCYFTNRNYRYFMVFSDDMAWCKENLNTDRFPECKFTYSEGNPPKKDMILLSQCEHQIIANSTFSWWGAWLNRNPQKIVIAPEIWFGKGNAHLETKDILPVEWIKM